MQRVAASGACGAARAPPAATATAVHAIRGAATKTMEADAVKAETDAQKAYEAFVKDTNASMEEKSRDITNKSEEKATAEADKVLISI